VSRAIVARAPTRLDFGGGWTDVPPYCEREGGAVCNIAITRYATASISAGAYAPLDQTLGDDALIRAAIRRSPLGDVHATLTSDFPLGAGLGGSSAAGVALAGGLAHLAKQDLGLHALALHCRQTEVQELGVAGGYQDHFAAAFGGALLLEFSQDVRVERIAVKEDARASLVRRGILVYTGESRISGEQITAVRDAYLAGDVRVVKALARMKALAYEMAASLRAGDVDSLAALVGEHWTHQRALHPSITTARIDAIADAAARAGALGMKALGASGGGSVIVFARDGREDELARALAPLGTRLSYDIDSTGFDVIAAMDDHHDG
jgi:D-glycero-alpha-D-manno-heptose-7-phosphate kinase